MGRYDSNSGVGGVDRPVECWRMRRKYLEICGWLACTF